MQTKLEASGRVERSSPEDSIHSSLPGLGFFEEDSLGSFLPAAQAPVDTGFQKSGRDSQTYFSSVPLMTSGIFPYQPDPFSAFLAAALTLAVQSLKEQGHIDFEAIGLLLDSTDFWAGVVGSGFAAYTHNRASAGISNLGKKRFPNAYAKLSKMKILNSIISGLTFTIAVSSGFEYFSQFWKLSTENIENVSRVSDLVTAERKDIIPVLSNLFMYVLDPGTQKRILDSIYHHRILTYEFMATNVALFIGLVVGEAVAKKKTPAAWGPWKKRLARYFGSVLGGTAAGVLVQFTPDMVRVKVNRELLHYKIGKLEKDLDKKLDRLQEALAYRMYRYQDRGHGLLAAGVEQVELDADLDRINRTFDLLNSFYMQQIFTLGEEEEGFKKLQRNFERLEFVFQKSLREINRGMVETPDWDQMKPSEIERLAFHDRQRSRLDEFYTQTLQIESENIHEDQMRMMAFISEMRSAMKAAGDASRNP